jgi:hypothetical protein
MSRTKHLPQAPVANDKPFITGTALAERLLIGGLTALIIARCLIASDDPGRLRLSSGGGPLTLNLLTFALLAGWATWAGWARRPFLRGRAVLVPVGLLLVAGAVFASTAMPDRYRHPGWFLGWEWASIAVLCFLTWQLASTPALARGLTAVLIAVAASLAAQALYQAVAPAVGLPATEAETPAAGDFKLVGDNEFGIRIDDPAPPRGSFRATFPQPEAFACFLLLLLPAALCWGIAGWRGGRPIAILLAACFVAASWPLLFASRENVAPLLAIVDHKPWLGAGPGNLSRIFGAAPSGMSGYWLGLAATSGLIGAGLALATLLAALHFGARIGRQPSANSNQEGSTLGSMRWAFYFGGVAGLLLGLILATGDLPAEAPPAEVLRLGAVAAGRAFVWFLAFALLENAPLSDRARRLALVIGASLVALAGFFCDALSSPALMQSFWIAVTLSLSSELRPGTIRPSGFPWAWCAVFVAAALLAGNFVHVGLSGLHTAACVRDARTASAAFPYTEWRITGTRGPERPEAMRFAKSYLENNVLQPLRTAAKSEPGNSALLLELAHWGRFDWRYRHQLQEDDQARREALEMLGLAELSARLDPRNLTAQLSVFESLLLFTRNRGTALPEQINSLERYIALVAAREPAREVKMRFRVAIELAERQNPESVDRWTVHLLRLAAEEGTPHGALTEDERLRLFDRLRHGVPNASPELRQFLDEEKKKSDAGKTTWWRW